LRSGVRLSICNPRAKQDNQLNRLSSACYCLFSSVLNATIESFFVVNATALRRVSSREMLSFRQFIHEFIQAHWDAFYVVLLKKSPFVERNILWQDCPMLLR